MSCKKVSLSHLLIPLSSACSFIHWDAASSYSDVLPWRLFIKPHDDESENASIFLSRSFILFFVWWWWKERRKRILQWWWKFLFCMLSKNIRISFSYEIDLKLFNIFTRVSKSANYPLTKVFPFSIFLNKILCVIVPELVLHIHTAVTATYFFISYETCSFQHYKKRWSKGRKK